MWVPAKTYKKEEANPRSVHIAPEIHKDARHQNLIHPYAVELFVDTELLYTAVISLVNALVIKVENTDNGLVLTRGYVPPKAMGRIEGTPEQMGKASWAGERRPQGPTDVVLNTGRAHIWGNREGPPPPTGELGGRARKPALRKGKGKGTTPKDRQPRKRKGGEHPNQRG